MSAVTKPPTETLAEIDEAINLTKLKLVNLRREVTAARTEAVASGVVGSTSPRLRQLAKKVDEAEARFVELEKEQAIALRLAEQEAEIAVRARVDESVQRWLLRERLAREARLQPPRGARQRGCDRDARARARGFETE